MNHQFKIALLWILIVFCYLLHGYYHVAELFFGVDIKIPDAKGEVPLSSHLFSLLIEIVPLSAGLAALYVTRKWFTWASLVFAILLGLLNVVHLVMTFMHESSDIRQLALLAFIIAVNILLVKELNISRKSSIIPN
ncbi:hypothetical protein [Chitinophaga sp. YIM B06452]|uniref:hypothetical protein n=1 Tax=Chitinophaga sp. YIM B06452 TaxID=3082158 RepID=UPI0031FE7EC2